jgi:hypothetical protein
MGAGAPGVGAAAAKGAPQERQNLLVGWLVAPHRVQTIMTQTPESYAAHNAWTGPAANQKAEAAAAYPVSRQKARNRSGFGRITSGAEGPGAALSGL